jgi:hypothetical protein
MKISTLCLLCMHSFSNIYNKASNRKSRFLKIYSMSFIALLHYTPQIRLCVVVLCAH